MDAPVITSPAVNQLPPQQAAVNQLPPQQAEGFRIFGKISVAVLEVAAVVAAVVAAAQLFPAMATGVFAGLPLAATISIIAICTIAAAVLLFALERLGRDSGLANGALEQARAAEAAALAADAPLADAPAADAPPADGTTGI